MRLKIPAERGFSRCKDPIKRACGARSALRILLRVSRMKLLIAALVALAFPATAWGEATIVTRELPVNDERTLAATQAPQRFNLLGLHWRGPGRVFFRVLGRSGWTGWHEADAEPEDLPDRGTNEIG